MWCQINIFFSTVLSSDSKIALNGKLTKAKAEYQNPTSIQFRWFNFFDDDNNRETAWVHCGGKSVLSNDKFSLIDNVTIEEFDRSMTTMPQMISWYSEAFGTTEEEIAKVYTVWLRPHCVLLYITKKNQLCRDFLGVLTHTTAWYRLWFFKILYASLCNF